MEFILLDTGVSVPLGSIVGYFLTGAVGILTWLIKKYLDRIDKRLDCLEEAREESELAIEKALSISESAIANERERSRVEMRIVDTRITELHINILNRLDDIKDKFNEARK